MNAALFDLLPDFGPKAPGTSKAFEPSQASPFAPTQSAAPEIAQPDLGALIAEAVAQAEADLAMRLNEAHQSEIAALEATHLAEKTALMETLGGDVGKAVADKLAEMEYRVASLTGTVVARLLSGHLSKDMQKRSLDALAQTLTDALSDNEALRIKVRGPALLLQALQSALGPLCANLDFTETDSLDLTATMDDVVFETRMGEWAAALSEILA